jgi:hypothetical protein
MGDSSASLIVAPVPDNPASFRIGVDWRIGADTQYAEGELTLDKPVTVVWGWDRRAKTYSLWVNRGAGAFDTPNLVVEAKVDQQKAFVIPGTNDLWIDELKIGKTWSSLFFGGETSGTPVQAIVTGLLQHPSVYNNFSKKKGFSATTESMDRIWRAEFLNAGIFRLSGEPLQPDDFKVGTKIRVWEYGPGDVVRLTTRISLTRTAPRTYRLSGNVGGTVAFVGTGIRISADGNEWRDFPTKVMAGKASADLDAATVIAGTWLQIGR